MADYIPRPDPEFQNWQANFVTYANANLAALGLVAGDMTPITTAQTAWGTAYTDHLAKQAARALKDMKREAHEGAIRPLVKPMVRASPRRVGAENPG